MRQVPLIVRLRAVCVLAPLMLLGACALPAKAPAPRLYDFGPPSPTMVESAAAAAAAAAARPALALRVQTGAALEGAAMQYRLAYADAQELRAYTQARWAMPVAELVQQRLRAGLAGAYTVVQPGEGAARAVYIDVEEFSQIFDAPEQSQGVLHLRVRLVQRAGGERLLAQREWDLRRPAASADAPGGVRALAAASDAAAAELLQWLRAQP